MGSCLPCLKGHRKQPNKIEHAKPGDTQRPLQSPLAPQYSVARLKRVDPASPHRSREDRQPNPMQFHQPEFKSDVIDSVETTKKKIKRIIDPLEYALASAKRVSKVEEELEIPAPDERIPGIEGKTSIERVHTRNSNPGLSRPQGDYYYEQPHLRSSSRGIKITSFQDSQDNAQLYSESLVTLTQQQLDRGEKLYRESSITISRDPTLKFALSLNSLKDTDKLTEKKAKHPPAIDQVVQASGNEK